MRLSDGQLLQVWEQGFGRTSSERALIMLAACEPDRQPTELCEWSVGERDRRLLQLRQQLFGNQASMTTQCEGCKQPIEFSLALDDLILDQPATTGTLSAELDEWRTTFRVPSAGDMIAIQTVPAAARRKDLMKRCILAIEQQAEKVVEIEDLPPALVERVIAAMARADQQAEIDIGLTCDECGNRWSDRFDIGSFLWRELNDWAQKLLLQVHCLAKAYGWTQEEVLKLSRWRRQVYLGMARQ